MSMINLGKQGETNVRQVQLDVSRLVTLFGPGTVQLLHRRPGDVTPYPVALTRTGDVVTWTVTAADTAYSGEGQAELQYFAGDSLAKSETYTTTITASQGDAGATPPEPQVGWVTQVLQAGTSAAEAAERAERAALHPPIIGENGNWWLWSFAEGVYIDSGTPAAGGSSENAVLYTEQELSGDQKTQARENIGAVSKADVEEMLGIKEEEFSVSGELAELNLDLEPGTGLEVVSKIRRDETWGESNKLVLHQVSGVNFFDMTSFLGGVGAVFSKNGLTATVNADSTVTVQGTNESTGYTYIVETYRFDGELSARVYPAGTYTIPPGFMMAVRAAQYPKNVVISSASGNLFHTVTISEPFRIIAMIYDVAGGATVDATVPLGLFRGNAAPETGFGYVGNIYTATFDHPVYEGEFNWATGELKDANGNTVGYYDSHDIVRLDGVNYFWTGFGENTISNLSNDFGKVILRLNEVAPAETVPSICDFMLTPTTMEAGYGLFDQNFVGGGKFYGGEVPVLTTKGTLSVRDAAGNTKFSKHVGPLFNARGVSDALTESGLTKKWSKKFYLTKAPATVTHIPAANSWTIDNDQFIWEFDESEFLNTGIPAKIHDIPVASPCFINNDSAEDNVNTKAIYNQTPYPAFFSYNAETGKYTLTARGIEGWSIQAQLTQYSKVHFYYQLETPYADSFAFAMGIEAGDQITFDADFEDAQPYITDGVYRNSEAKKIETFDVSPSVAVIVPRSVKDAMGGMSNAAIILNKDGTPEGGDATVQGYSWIGAGDGVTDYTVKIQTKLNELHSITKGGTIHLGPGAYPISGSLIVYNNTQIMGNGHTIIEQRADNTHAVIWNGSNIRMSDLTIKLAGECSELTACIFANDSNTDDFHRDERYPVNAYVQYCSLANVVLMGDYRISYDDNYGYLSEKTLAYRGVGIHARSQWFNFFDGDGITCKNLYAGASGAGGGNTYRLYVVESRSAVRGGGGNNIFNITGHTDYANGKDGKRVCATEYVYHGERSDSNDITLTFYDIQFAKGMFYFDGKSQGNRYTSISTSSGVSNTGQSTIWETGYVAVTDFGRGNRNVQPYNEWFVGIGTAVWTLSSLPVWNNQLNPSIHNALSGAGVWGAITSNVEWVDTNGLGLSDVCRYPKEYPTVGFGLASAMCQTAPSKESPVEIVIDISDRPVVNALCFWIQFDHRYIAADYTVHFDTTNDGTFDKVAATIIENHEAVSYRLNYQERSTMVYRIKISITKALQIPGFVYHDANYAEYTIDYNPNGYIGIVNIGMPSNEAYGRAFLGECGGSLYGNVNMHQNTMKNLPAPVDDGDAVSKAYLDQRLAALEALISGT